MLATIRKTFDLRWVYRDNQHILQQRHIVTEHIMNEATGLVDHIEHFEWRDVEDSTE